tara:strand:+ start:705 stop:962 length:258 start_codon:yes stop_codon:yes gene_type:complete
MDIIISDMSEKLASVKAVTVPAFVVSCNVMVKVLELLYPIGTSAKEMFERRRVAAAKLPVKFLEANGIPANTAAPVDDPLADKSR